MSEFKQKTRESKFTTVEFWQHENHAIGIVKEMRHHPNMQGVTLYLRKNKTWSTTRQCENIIINAQVNKQIENKMSAR